MKHSKLLGIITLTLIFGFTNVADVEAKEKKHQVHAVKSKHTARSKPQKNIIKTTGMASWYGYESGPKTADGHYFNPKAMTAAHRSLAFGTKIKVTNLSNNKSIIVVINDRGPYHGSRILDLSKYAAKAIGITGVSKVSFVVV